MQEVFSLYVKYLGLFLDTAWIWMPVILAVIFFESWMYYIQRYYWQKLDWVLLEIKPPRDIERTPKTMEQIFAGFWGSYGTISTKYEKYVKGVLQDYFSVELVGSGGEAHFYIRALRKYRDLVEAQVYSQYPQAEIKEVSDYTQSVPADIPNKKWDLWGCVLKLANKDYYPLRTYVHLIDVTKNDQPFIDPLAGLMEIFGKLRLGENIWFQILFRPAADDWQKKAKELADKLLGKKAPAKKEGVLGQDIRTWKEAFIGVFYEFFFDKPAPSNKKESKEEPYSLAQYLSPGEKEVIQGIEEKASKKGYECKIQWAYIAKKEVYSATNVSAVMGVMNQFSNLNMNSLKPIPETVTSRAYYLFTAQRKFYKKRVMMRLLRARSFWEKGYILNIEELASLYHFPTASVKAPVTPYIEIKKAEAPLNLPVEK